MVYSAKTQRVIQFGFFLLMVQAMILNKGHPEMLYFLVPMTIVTLARIFIRYHLHLSVLGSLVFEIYLFHYKIFTRKIRYTDITRMTFMRVGLGKRCVIIQTRRGLNLRIINFSPDSVYDDLIKFADRYHILIYKTKDYRHLEKTS